MEETAFALDLLVDSEKPVIVTGAMRNAGDPGFDGPAQSHCGRARGNRSRRTVRALVVMNEEIHAARFVTNPTVHS